jgi:hypothetical protein
MRRKHATYLLKGATITTRAKYFDDYGRPPWYVAIFGADELPRVLCTVHKRVGRERDARDEDSDFLTSPEEELELAGETLSRLVTQLDNARDY